MSHPSFVPLYWISKCGVCIYGRESPNGHLDSSEKCKVLLKIDNFSASGQISISAMAAQMNDYNSRKRFAFDIDMEIETEASKLMLGKYPPFYAIGTLNQFTCDVIPMD